jgi:hypothetical protein
MDRLGAWARQCRHDGRPLRYLCTDRHVATASRPCPQYHPHHSMTRVCWRVFRYQTVSTVRTCSPVCPERRAGTKGYARKMSVHARCQYYERMVQGRTPSTSTGHRDVPAHTYDFWRAQHAAGHERSIPSSTAALVRSFHQEPIQPCCGKGPEATAIRAHGFQGDGTATAELQMRWFDHCQTLTTGSGGLPQA